MSKRCRRIKYALVVMTYTVLLCGAGYDECFSAPRTDAGERQAAVQMTADSMQIAVQTAAQMAADGMQIAAQTSGMTDLTDAFSVILQGATKEFIAGYAVDESFLMWLDTRFGDEIVMALADDVSEGRLDPQIWYEKTGSSIHVLWLMYCRDSGFQEYRLAGFAGRDAGCGCYAPEQ